jgi:hypothetical protein
MITCSSCPGSASTRPSPGRRHAQLDVLAEQAAQHLLDARRASGSDRRPRLEHLLAAEGEELPRQLRRPLAGAPDLVEVVAQRVAVASSSRMRSV